jgi:ATP-binding cassette subfamily B protein RaxB
MVAQAILRPARRLLKPKAQLAERLQLRRRGVPLVFQSEAAECGLACLAMVASYHGHRIDLPSLRRRFPLSLRGLSLRRLMSIAASMHLSGRALRIELGQLSGLRTPCILHWDLDHFVVLVRVRADRAVIHDPALGRRVYSTSEVSRHLTGIVLELAPTPAFERKPEERQVQLRDLWTRIEGLGKSIGMVVLLSVLLQVVLMAGPFYTQLVVDEVLSNRDAGLLKALAVGFALVLAMRATVSLLRDYAVLYMSTLLSFQIGANLLGHLIRLPLPYFQKRHIGDVLSRFRSVGPIEQLLTTGFVAASVDGVMALASLAMMCLYSVSLALFTLAVAAVFTGLRLAVYRTVRQAREEEITARAREETNLVEIIRGIQAIKLLGAEAQREALWQNRRSDTLSASVRASRWQISISALHTFLFGCENLIVIYAIAQRVLEGPFTVGMLYAYLAYKTQFSERISQLIDWGIQYRMLDVHLRRLGDIVHTPEERGLRGSASPGVSLAGRIELRSVSFRYAESDAYVLKDVSLVIEAGTSAALIGRSGSGKTTLLKVILGLLEPSEGDVLVDNRPLRSEGVEGYRSQIGAVMQDDDLFEGTIAENIAAFDPDEDAERVEAAACAAFIHEDILAMPMAYRSLVGNMGSSLSGGQRQRLLLARAFYRQPRLLALDEGTANLDPGLLEQVWKSISSLDITRVIATHQHMLLESVDQVVVVENGRIVESEDAPSAAVPRVSQRRSAS